MRVVLFWTFCFFVLTGFAQEPLRKKIDDQKKRLNRLSKQETSLHTDLQQAYQRSEKLEKDIARLEKQKKELELNLLETNIDISSMGQSIEDKRQDAFSTIKSFSMFTQPNLMQAFFSSTSISDFQYKRWLVRRWIRHEGERLQDFQVKAEGLVERKVQVGADKEKLSKLLGDLAFKKKQLQGDQRERRRLLSLVQDQKEYYLQSIQEMESSAKDLQKLMDKIKRTPASGSSRFKQMQGKLLMPLRGKIERSYGPYVDQRLNTKVYHKGMDIRAPAKTPVKAVFDGKVAYADWFVGYGKIVIIDHDGEYFTLYAHLSDILKSVGDQVVVGEPIAKVGDTGSLKGSYLYFELRKKGISEDPRPWFSVTSGR